MMLKEGVRPFGLQPQIVLAIMVAQALWTEEGDILVITSLADSRHSHTSLHYSGNAVDFRTHDPNTGELFIHDPAEKARELDRRLGMDYDVLYEGDHIHCEYQPRRMV